ncbi:hypothetical protein [Polaribacter butkevichii]|uniref:DM13 domain-containing protein n=1 Tax=Polaribacter butkevichii TaxID=218490 RepID=A0A2P6C9Q2_9FLAO|nr:hypothetical protein [Polaribacter butkevichii]PQJ69642.1 hypothetical protein BTO14_16755 [Polaribacter butkevichii]
MKKIQLLIILAITLICYNCIGEDVIIDEVEPELRILSTTQSISISQTANLEATYFNNVGQPESTNIIWSSNNEAVLSVNSVGLITALSEGTAVIKAQVIKEGQLPTEDTISITVTEKPEVPNTNTNTPEVNTIRTTSSYNLQGSFTVSEIENTDNILIDIQSDYEATTALPGLYVYLTNNPNSINGALEIGKVTVFKGEHSYTINNQGINNYKYLLYWCKPFGVKVGDGKFNN